jgi:cell division protease FtsH
MATSATTDAPTRKNGQEQAPRSTPVLGGRGTSPGRRPRLSLWPLLLGVLALFAFNYWAASRAVEPAPRLHVPYSPFFLEQVRDGNVRSITSTGSAVQGSFRRAVRYPKGAKGSRSTQFATEIPAFADTDRLATLLQSKGVVVNAEPLETGAPWWQSLLFGFGPTLLLLGLMFWLIRRAAAGGGGALASFGRSRARRYDRDAGERVTFADVAGIDEAKDELAEVVDFLRNPAKYRKLGGRIPRGVLLSGPPGTGKTLLARAVAGEAKAPFFSMSASEFIEMIVGVGASRVRDLFAQAKEAAPAIVFIDELDAIGRSRAGGIGASFTGGHDEREQTLNQILTEMDGFDPTTGVIVIGATNRPDVLDPALLRPGRFDRRIAVQPPDRLGRKLILAVHTRPMPLAPDVDLDRIAGSTPGMVGADLANLANEAALLAARRGQERVGMADFTEALERIVLGAERKIVLSDEDRRRTAYHEAGHAIVGMVTPEADPVRKVSIIPRGMALGVTFAAPDADRFSYGERYLLARIKVALGGRAAEELVYGDVTTGAESDIRQLTEISRQMVGRWGMSPAIGAVAVLPADGGGPLLPAAEAPSERTHELIDAEVRRIVDGAYEDVTALLSSERERLDALAQALVEHETLDEADAYAAAGLPHAGDEVPAEAQVGPQPVRSDDFARRRRRAGSVHAKRRLHG